jgi:hypothetical protein
MENKKRKIEVEEEDKEERHALMLSMKELSFLRNFLKITPSTDKMATDILTKVDGIIAQSIYEENTYVIITNFELFFQHF